MCAVKKNQAVRLPNASSLSLSFSFYISPLYIYHILVTPPHIFLSHYLYYLGVHCASVSEKAAQSSVPSSIYMYIYYIILLPRTDNIIITDYDGKNIYGGKAG